MALPNRAPLTRGGVVPPIPKGNTSMAAGKIAAPMGRVRSGSDPTYDDTGSSFPSLMSQSSKRVQLKQLRGQAAPVVRPTPLRAKH